MVAIWVKDRDPFTKGNTNNHLTFLNLHQAVTHACWSHNMFLDRWLSSIFQVCNLRSNSLILSWINEDVTEVTNHCRLWLIHSTYVGVHTAGTGHLLTLRAQLTKSSSLVITYSPLLLATDAGLAAATAVLFSLTGTTLQQKDGGDLYHVQGVYWVSVLYSHVYTPVFVANSRGGGGILAFCTAMQTLLLNSKHRNWPVGWRAGQREKQQK